MYSTKRQIFYARIAVVFAWLFVYSLAIALPVLGPDGIPWEYKTQARVVEIGDLHGDDAALEYILKQKNLIDENGRWIGAHAHLVLNGDLFNRGPHSKRLIDRVMNLEQQALEAGGHVHVILGNHEILVTAGKYDMLSETDKIEFAASLAPGEAFSRANLQRSLMDDSPYAKWLRGLNSIVKINDDVFVHAGLGKWALDTELAAVNSTVRAWMKYYQTYRSPDLQRAVASPPLDTQWVITPEHGPMWTAAMNDERNDQAPGADFVTPRELNKIFEIHHIRYLPVAHIMTRDFKIGLEHSRYGKRVIQTDTGISSYYGGQLSALTFSSNGIEVWHADRPPIQCAEIFQ